MYKLVQQFRIEQKNTELLYAQKMSGDFFSRKKCEIDKRKKLFEIFSTFNKNEIKNYLGELILII